MCKGESDSGVEPKELAAACLRGEATTWPAGAGSHEIADFLKITEGHGIQPLLAHRLQLHQAKAVSGWPLEIHDRLTQAARAEALAELVRRREIERVLTALDTAGVSPLLMKGTALAYLCYPHPWLRPRCDTDTTCRVMRELGYQAVGALSGDLAMPQRAFVKNERSGVRHAYDFHTRITNPMPFARLLPFEEAMSRAVPVHPLGASARALGPTDALLLACVHRVAHHRDSDKFLWLYDVHLLAEGMSAREFDILSAMATRKGVRAICGRSLALARRWFGTVVPDGTMEAFAGDDRSEATAVYLDRSKSRADLILSDLRALRGWSSRWRLVRQHLFPRIDYMRERYSTRTSAVLPTLYVKRWVRGARSWLRRPGVRRWSRTT